MVDFRAEKGMHKVILEHRKVPEGKEVLKNG